jgi:CDP-diacylglycerol---glycerol-3-phosphate 3-phosphatidyltransferase
MNCIGYREDEEFFTKVLGNLGEEDFMRLASGYLNLPKEYLKALSKSLHEHKDLNVEILTASPSANGFYRAGRIKGNIPGVYRVVEEKILKLGHKNLSMHEYSNRGWTFHAKGAWFYENASDKVAMSVIGSSNFCYRSNRRDTECQLYVVSECEEFQKKLHKEAENLYGQSQ